MKSCATPPGQLTDSFEALGLREGLARARQLGVAFLRDCESLIKAAVKAARFDKESDRHEASGKKAVKVAGIKSDVETPGIENRAECPVKHPGDDDNHQPQIEDGIRTPRSQDRQNSETKQQNRCVHNHHSGCVAVADQDSRQELMICSSENGQHANGCDSTSGGPNHIDGHAARRAPAHDLAPPEQRIADQEQRETPIPEHIEPGAALRVGTE